VLDAVSGAELWRLDRNGPVNAVAFSPDGTQVATASNDRSARVRYVDHNQLIEQATGRLIRNLTREDGPGTSKASRTEKHLLISRKAA
jgi:WD40 repeat protein